MVTISDSTSDNGRGASVSTAPARARREVHRIGDHTVEWTTQLLYDEVLYNGMNANWHGLVRTENLVTRALDKVAVATGKSVRESDQTTWYGVFVGSLRKLHRKKFA